MQVQQRQLPTVEIFYHAIYHIMQPPTQPHNRAVGANAEDLAVEFLERKGMNILSRNFHFGKVGEIDIVAQEAETLVFVEVKARRSDTFGTPEEAITPRKQAALRRAAEGYLYVHKMHDRECRFDVVAIELQHSPPSIRHIVNAL